MCAFFFLGKANLVNVWGQVLRDRGVHGLVDMRISVYVTISHFAMGFVVLISRWWSWSKGFVFV